MKRMKKTVMTLVVISMLLSGLAGNGLAAGAKKKVRLNKTKVTLSVAGVVKGKKVINFKAKRRKGERRKVGHRQQLTVATVTAIA